MRWATTLGVAAGAGLLAGTILAGTRDDSSKVEVADGDVVLLPDYSSGHTVGLSVGDPMGPADGFTSREAAAKWAQTKEADGRIGAAIVDPSSKRIVLHELLSDGKVVTNESVIGDMNPETYIDDTFDGFRDTNPSDGTVEFLALAGSWETIIEPGHKNDKYVPAGASARELLGLDAQD
jgi:hypothetical protein